MCGFISIFLIVVGIYGGNEMLVVASGLYAIGAEILALKNKI